MSMSYLYFTKVTRRPITNSPQCFAHSNSIPVISDRNVWERDWVYRVLGYAHDLETSCLKWLNRGLHNFIITHVRHHERYQLVFSFLCWNSCMTPCFWTVGFEKAKVWGQGDVRKSQIAQSLACASLQSDSLVFLDSLITAVIFGKNPNKSAQKQRTIKVLSKEPTPNLDEAIVRTMKHMYQKSKDCAQAPGADATWYLHCMSELAQALRSKFEAFQAAPQEVLAWLCLC